LKEITMADYLVQGMVIA